MLKRQNDPRKGGARKNLCLGMDHENRQHKN
jgi:hypothetical protein